MCELHSVAFHNSITLYRITTVRCVVVSCDKHMDPRPGSDQEQNISFYRIPTVQDQAGKEEYA